MPPWKKNPEKVIEKADIEDNIAGNTSEVSNGGFKATSSLPNTFKGVNGGTAEDAELLAELMAISSKSSGNRFVNGSQDEVSAADNTEGQSTNISVPMDLPPPPTFKAKPATRVTPPVPPIPESEIVQKPGTPPWKKDRAPKPKSISGKDDNSNEGAVEENGGFKANAASTFKGKNGGDANDAELLAELMAISSKSQNNRFEGADDTKGSLSVEAVSTSTTSAPIDAGENVVESNEGTSSPVPPWKKKGAKKSASKSSESKSGIVPPWKKRPEQSSDVVDQEDSLGLSKVPYNDGQENNTVSSTSPGFEGGRDGFKSDLPNTFKGDRGGTAEDADLLAELLAISSKSKVASTSVIADKNSEESAENGRTITPRESPSLISHPSAVPSTIESTSEVSLTKELLAEAIESKKWKMRKEAFIFLSSLIAEAVSGGQNCIVADSLFPSLDDKVTLLVKDSNAGALDAALQFANDYAEHCDGATSEDRAASIATSEYEISFEFLQVLL